MQRDIRNDGQQDGQTNKPQNNENGSAEVSMKMFPVIATVWVILTMQIIYLCFEERLLLSTVPFVTA